MSKISIIIPVYNAEKYLDECLYCVINQTYKNIEVILVDDGSTDNSSYLCDVACQKDERIRVIHQKNKGLPGARNSGLKAATGEWIFFLDVDDWIHLNTMEILMNVVQKKHSLDMILFDVLRTTDYKPGIIDKSNYVINARELTKQEICSIRDDCFDPMNEQFMEITTAKLVACSKLYRKSFLLDNSLLFFEEVKIHEDVPYAVSVYGKARNVVFLPLQLYFYRQVPGSITHCFRPNYPDEMKKMMDKLLELKESYEDSSKVDKLFDNRMISVCIYLLIRCFCNKENPDDYMARKKQYLLWIKDNDFYNTIIRADIYSYSFKKMLAAMLVKKNNFFILDLVFSKVK